MNDDFFLVLFLSVKSSRREAWNTWVFCLSCAATCQQQQESSRLSYVEANKLGRRMNCNTNSKSCLPVQNRSGAVSQLQYELGKILCDVHSCDGVVIAGWVWHWAVLICSSLFEISCCFLYKFKRSTSFRQEGWFFFFSLWPYGKQ